MFVLTRMLETISIACGQSSNVSPCTSAPGVVVVVGVFPSSHFRVRTVLLADPLVRKYSAIIALGHIRLRAATVPPTKTPPEAAHPGQSFANRVPRTGSSLKELGFAPKWHPLRSARRSVAYGTAFSWLILQALPLCLGRQVGCQTGYVMSVVSILSSSAPVRTGLKIQPSSIWRCYDYIVQRQSTGEKPLLPVGCDPFVMMCIFEVFALNLAWKQSNYSLAVFDTKQLRITPLELPAFDMISIIHLVKGRAARLNNVCCIHILPWRFFLLFDSNSFPSMF